MLEGDQLGKVHLIRFLFCFLWDWRSCCGCCRRLLKAGQSVDEILALVQTMRANFYIYFLVDTLEFLQKGGRIGKASALFGSLLNIKPILTLDRAGEVSSRLIRFVVTKKRLHEFLSC